MELFGQELPEEIPRPKIKNLIEKTGADAEKIAKLKAMAILDALAMIRTYNLIIAKGGNIHRSNPRQVAKNRAANKAARAARRKNRRD